MSGAESMRSFSVVPSNPGCFGANTMIPGVSGAYAVVATDDVGGIFVAYQSHWMENGSFFAHVYFSFSHDYGKSWSESIRINDNGSSSVHCDSPNIAVDRNTGYVYVAWKDNRTGVAKVYIDKSVDCGVSFGSDVLVYDWSQDQIPTGIYSLYTVNIEVGVDGIIYIVWIAYYSYTYTNCDIFFSKSIDNAHTFTTPTSVTPREIAARHRNPWIAVDGENIVYVAYSKSNSSLYAVYLAKSLDGGITFGTPVKVNDDFGTGYRGGKNVVVAPDGKIHVAWTDGRNGFGMEYVDIYFATSFDGGVSFGPNVCVNDDLFSSSLGGLGKTVFMPGPQGTPSLVADSDSMVHIVWEDFRNYVSDYTYCRDVYYASSEDGTRFSKNVRVNHVRSDVVSVSCADPYITIDSQDNLFIVYSDAISGDEIHQIYFTFAPGWAWKWPQFRHDSGNTGFSPSTAPRMNITHWNYTTSGPIESSPAVTDGKVLIGASNKIYALNDTTGELIWSYTAGDMIKTSPAVTGEIVFAGSIDKNVYALNINNGNLIWNYTTSDSIVSSPNIAEGLVFIGSNDSKLYALNQTTGQLVWNFTTESSVMQSPALTEGLVFIGSGNKMYALNKTSGNIFWQQTYNTRSSAAVLGGHVFFGSNSSVYCLNETNGSILWETSTDGAIHSSPAIAYGKVFFGCENNGVYALNETNGSILWQYYTGDVVRSSPVACDGFVFIGTNDYNLYALNETNGQLIWKYSTTGEVYSSPALANSRVYVGSYDGNVYALGELRDLAVINVTTSKIIIGQGQNLNINVTLENQGNCTETFNVKVFANATEIDGQGLTLAGGDSESITFMWNTTGFVLGNYTITAIVDVIAVEAEIEDNNLTAEDEVCVTLPGDIDGDRDVDIFDIVRIASIYGITKPDPRYDPNCDIDGDGDIDIFDIVLAAGHYGENW